MGGSRGLMGPEAFAQLRAMVDKLLSKKQDKLTAGANVAISGSTISAKDTTYTEATAAKAGLMSAADKKKLDKAIKSGDELMTTNPFTPGATLYISKIDNAFYAADKRFNVSAEVERPDGSVVPLNSLWLAKFFDGDYESCYELKGGCKLVLRMKFDNQWEGAFPGYPYGNILISSYYDETPREVSVRLYCNYEPHGVGWKTLVGSRVGNSKYTNMWSFRNDYARVTQIEFTFVGSEDNTYGYTGITQIEMHLDRPYSGRNPFLSKYAAEELYYPLTAPRFVGSLQGTADAAEKLATARRITFEGAASGSALFDGSGDVTVTLSSSAQAPSFLAAHPPGSIYRETTGRSPAAEWGGTWRLVDSLDGFAWLRTDSGRSDNFTAAQFLAAHPVGCIFEWNKATNPGAVYGGTWVDRPSVGAFLYERTE